MRRDDRPGMPEVAAMLAERMRDLARELVGGDPTHRGREEWRYGRRGSLAVVVAGPKCGSWHDHEAGEGGDALALVAHLHRTPMRAAWEWALAWLGVADGGWVPRAPERPAAPPACERRSSGTADLAHALWREAVPADAPGSLVAIYLASRGLHLPDDPDDPDVPAVLRFHPACPRGAERWPAMLALMTDPATGEPCGVHRTFLARDGSAKASGPLPAKMMAGRAGVVRLVPDEDVTMGLGIAEGIETALSVMQGYGWRPVWAATSAGMIRTFPVLAGIEALTVFADADGAGMDAAEACGVRWAAARREAEIIAAPAGEDFNDTLRSRVA